MKTWILCFAMYASGYLATSDPKWEKWLALAICFVVGLFLPPLRKRQS